MLFSSGCLRGKGSTWTAISSLAWSTTPPPREQSKWESRARGQDLPSQGWSGRGCSVSSARSEGTASTVHPATCRGTWTPTPQSRGKTTVSLIHGSCLSSGVGQLAGVCGAVCTDQAGVPRVSLRGLQLFIG